MLNVRQDNILFIVVILLHSFSIQDMEEMNEISFLIVQNDKSSHFFILKKEKKVFHVCIFNRDSFESRSCFIGKFIWFIFRMILEFSASRLKTPIHIRTPWLRTEPQDVCLLLDWTPCYHEKLLSSPMKCLICKCLVAQHYNHCKNVM